MLLMRASKRLSFYLRHCKEPLYIDLNLLGIRDQFFFHISLRWNTDGIRRPKRLLPHHVFSIYHTTIIGVLQGFLTGLSFFS